MMKRITLSLIAAAAISAFAFTLKHDTVYNLDTKASSATWLAKKVTGQHSGTLKVTKGTITAEHGTLKGGNFELDMTSIAVTDLKAGEGKEKLEGHLKSEDFFSVDKHRTANLEITKFTPKSNTEFDVTGKLTIKGITNEITFPAKIKMDDKTFVGVATIMVDRTKYDIKYGSKSFVEGIGDKAIDDQFQMDVNIVASAGK
jgi:polyisoprenoid-binding protein YceI